MAERTDKKVAIVSDAIYPYNKGGKEKRIYEITRRLAAQGHDVTIYTMQWWKGGKTIVENGVRLKAISPLYPLYAGNRRSIKEAVLFSLHCFKLLGEKFDIMEVDHMPHLVLFPLKIVCVLKGKKMVVTWHEVWGKEYWKEYLGPGMKARVAYWVEKISARLPNLIISVSEHNTKRLRSVLKVKQPIVTIHNGLDMLHIINTPPAPQSNDLVFAGRLLSHKNVDILLRATKILRDRRSNISLSIIGEGPERNSLEALAKKLGIENNVSFLGFLDDPKELYRVLLASRVFILPSTREGFGIAALEANACGMPFITIDHENNATRELIVNGENGVLTDLDETQIADASEMLLDRPVERSFYRTYAERYDWDQIVAEVKKVYAS